ncbi:hypothetical protein SEA_LEONARD_86 [Gordonia phage Leonard]|uniref:DNA binding protein n=3 Tax=Leonardvirus TaxID=2948800 RepID=A0A649VM73_9CAUD|nr:DNA binding protein [Gordonia phage Phinally]YP_010002305.1 DNA binding protein [Gordonia phage Leonard]YP_010002560.1 DNA binding protein [Gordonia phage Ali17]QXN73304.1 helix-turn-helix DNA binding domain protein [Gordonia phage Hans]UTN93165.1 MerR-like helix-turn-helix DNA binding domain protein [Gordonia Phage Phauci]AMS03078.1 hypothetical protein SEA_PHINALLY_86 [Gordonia phage Phinally]AXQ60698.1 DNA binding protein [Gordonia phage Ali17]QGJ93448.1 hypothetical protein SEA_LEONAR
MAQRQLDLVAFAELAGVKYSTMRKYHQKAIQRRKEAAADKSVTVPPWMMPPPDGHVGQSPFWHERTARKWIDARPRAGAGRTA